MASNPQRVYWDSCTYIDYLEGGHPLADVMEMVQEDWRNGLVTMATSALTIAEVLFVRCGTPAKRLDRSRERDIEALFDPPPGQRLIIVEVSRLTALRARDLVWNASIKPKDAVHVASAIEAGCEVMHSNDGPLCTKSGLVGGAPLLRIQPPAWVRQLAVPVEIPRGTYTSLVEPAAPGLEPNEDTAAS